MISCLDEKLGVGSHTVIFVWNHGQAPAVFTAIYIPGTKE